ncbi:MAG: TetR family transcriptional regulator, partial [Pseudonocardiales bacterium]|nr:TetR family transcriptional regulator [Pseudonocardiales bacterium]
EAVRAAALALFAERGYRATTMADIGAALGIRGPSLYRYLSSKQDVLAEIMARTMTDLLAGQETARSSTTDPVLRLRRMVEAHVRFHTAHRDEAFVGSRELDSLEEPARSTVLELRHRYEGQLRAAVADGVRAGVFTVSSERLVSYAILDMGIGIAAWFRPDGPHSVDEIAYTYADHALAMLGVR